MTSGHETPPPPGWYPVDGGQRYWDGEAWTDLVSPLPPPEPAAGGVVGGAAPGAVVPRSTTDESTMATLIHISAIFTGIIGPVIIWALKRDQSDFVDRHGREAMNFQITLYIAAFISFILVFVLIGFLFLFAIFVAQILFPILAAVAASRGQDYRYPLTLRLL
ncbi:MAG: DUF4870 domain-containing protein [Acidimicrobiia bacterium]|nr:DUF4870 domain-containing protein [Acidimicrobiia bacterium]